MLRAARLGLLPRDIEDLSPNELALVLRGREEAERERWRGIAWQVATMINLWSQDKVSVDELLGGSRSADVDGSGIDAMLEEAAEMLERAEERDAAGWIDRLGVDSRVRVLDEVEGEP